MWGKTRRSTRYYLWQISHQRAADLPADHPPSVYVGERGLNEAILGFLATAVFGPDREEYWRHALTVAAKPEPRAPTLGRAEELAQEIADLEGRLERQVMGLESEDVTPALRRRVAQRVAELEEAISERQVRLERLAAQVAREAPQVDDVATVLARLPVIADRLRELPRANCERCSKPCSSPSGICGRATRAMSSWSSDPSRWRLLAQRFAGLVRAPGRIRTCGLSLRRRTLYPLSYGGKAAIVDPHIPSPGLGMPEPGGAAAPPPTV